MFWHPLQALLTSFRFLFFFIMQVLDLVPPFCPSAWDLQDITDKDLPSNSRKSEGLSKEQEWRIGVEVNQLPSSNPGSGLNQ